MPIQTLSPNVNAGSILGSALGQGIQTGAQKGLDYQVNRSRLQNALGSLQNLPANATPFELASQLMSATSGIPGAERYVGQLFPLLLQQLQAKQSQQVPHPAELPGQMQPAQRQELPQYGQGTPLAQGEQQGNQFFPTNLGGQQGPGNAPQAATSGQARQVYSPEELIPQARQLAQTRTAAGIPTTVQDAFKEVSAINDENKNHNDLVEKERIQRVNAQREYGEKASASLLKVMPDATEEQQAIFKKIGEKESAGSETRSEADIDRTIAKAATKFKNDISNVKNDLSAPRSYNYFQRKFLGKEKDFEQASKDLRLKLKPLLDQGLYDTSRNILQELGYYPEERESIINPLDERSLSTLNLIPEAQKQKKINKRQGISAANFGGPGSGFIGTVDSYNPKQIEDVRQGIQDVLQFNPNASLVLLRKKLEDKGYDWRIFKDILNDMVGKEITLTDDQQNQVQYLGTPPLDNLDKILHGLNLIGR